MNREKVADWLLRIGVALTFLYPPLSAFADPYTWLGYVPHFARGFVPDLVFLHSFGAIEVVIALWILSGKKIFWPSVLATLMLGAIVVFNSSDFQLLFRDVAIACMSAALAVLHLPSSRREESRNAAV